MSTFQPSRFDCPRCGHTFDTPLATSVNPGRAPQQRQAILDGSFQWFTCPGCGHSFEAVRPFVYLDLARRQCIAVFPSVDEPEWASLEGEVRQTIDIEMARAPLEAAPRLHGELKVRTVFGLAALREKILVLEAGLDDAVVEAMKLRILLNRDDHPASRGKLRVIDASGEGFSVAWSPGEGGDQMAVVSVDRHEYDAFAADPELVAGVFGRLREGTYCDMERLLVA